MKANRTSRPIGGEGGDENAISHRLKQTSVVSKKFIPAVAERNANLKNAHSKAIKKTSNPKPTGKPVRSSKMKTQGQFMEIEGSRKSELSVSTKKRTKNPKKEDLWNGQSASQIASDISKREPERNKAQSFPIASQNNTYKNNISLQEISSAKTIGSFISPKMCLCYRKLDAMRK
jgi:hypothetical protein